MIYSTKCNSCIFAKSADSDRPCEFYIIDELKDSRSDILSTKNNFYEINNYTCKYGFSKDKLDAINELLVEENIKDYIVKQNYIKYYTIIDNMSLNASVTDIVDFVNALAIKPKVISLITKTDKPQDLIDYFNKNISDKIIWRIHNFYNEDITNEMAAYGIMSTNKYMDECHYIWIVNDTNLTNRIESKHIEQINHIVNVIQPSLGILKQRNGDYFNGLFLTKKNYLMLTQTLNQSIKIATEEFLKINNMELITYD